LLILFFLGPHEEGADQVSGGRARCQVFIDVLLQACRGGAVMGGVKPGEKFDRLGDLLLGRAFGAVGGLAGHGVAADPPQVVPSGELLDRGPDGGLGDGVEFRGEPGLEPSEVFVAVGQQVVVLEQAA
jgi:hypothetical protein